MGSIDPAIPLPEDLEERLWRVMRVEVYCHRERSLVMEGDVPGKAFYVVHGLVKVYAWCADGYRYLYRIYRENTIVALKCFMDQTVSAYDIVACKNSLLWSISNEQMQKIYNDMEGMKEMALKTAFSYSEAKEKLRTDLLVLPMDVRLLKFYKLFKGLYPARTSPVKDEEIAAYLLLSIDVLRKARRRLKNEGLL